MINLIILLWLHHVGDVAFQPSWLIKKKKKHLFSHYEHAFVWAGLITIGLMIMGRYELWKFFFLLIVHGMIDYFKYKREEYWWIYPDQALHYIQILIVYYL
jgi:ABC-type uncharacterized transport system permease subunit